MSLGFLPALLLSNQRTRGLGLCSWLILLQDRVRRRRQTKVTSIFEIKPDASVEYEVLFCG
jgi:hypothetical protein